MIEGLATGASYFRPRRRRGWADVDEADALTDSEDAREGAVVRADTVPPPATFNRVFLSAAVSAAPPAEADAAQDAGAARKVAAEK